MFYIMVLSDKTWVFDQSQYAQGPIHKIIRCVITDYFIKRHNMFFLI